MRACVCRACVWNGSCGSVHIGTGDSQVVFCLIRSNGRFHYLYTVFMWSITACNVQSDMYNLFLITPGVPFPVISLPVVSLPVVSLPVVSLPVAWNHAVYGVTQEVVMDSPRGEKYGSNMT